MQEIPFETFGSKGQVIHFAHANAYTPKCYRQMLEGLGQHTQVLASHHRPLWDENYDAFSTWRYSADDLIQFLDQHRLKQVVGVGHSFGAIVTTLAAVKRPDLFSHLILLDPVLLVRLKLLFFTLTPNRYRHWFLPHIKSAKNRRHSWESAETAFDYFRSKKVFARFSDEAIRDLVKFGLIANEKGLALRFPREWEGQIYSTIPSDIWRVLAQTSQPMLGLAGDESDTLFDDAFEHWGKIKPQATLQKLPDAGHLFPMEYPQDTANRILTFLDKS